ncbi:MAG TPA: hypothetical protein VNG12_10710 [Acidimicrobiales bacterium]|nr:hypothetical protein [Acidimicrobiales bacterium]
MRTSPAAGGRQHLWRLRDQPGKKALLAFSALFAIGLPTYAATGPASAGLTLPSIPQVTLKPATDLLSPALAPVTPAAGALTAPVRNVLTPQPTQGPVASAPSAPGAAPGLQAPTVAAAQAGTTPDVVVTWAYPTSGVQATGAIVELDRISGASPGRVAQIKCGSCTSITFRQLAFASTYVARVFATDAAGEGAPGTSAPVTPTTSCTVAACVGIDAASSRGPANHAAAGLLGSLSPQGRDPSDAKALGTSIFRSSPGAYANNTYDWTNYGVATAAGAQTIVMLDALWKVDHHDVAPTPWSNWPAYSQWMKSTVSSLLASGKPIDYWDVYNEPGGTNGYYGSAAYASQTPALLLQQFLVAYQAIKAVDPWAQVIGPDLEYWSDYPGQYGPGAHTFDMVTFLNFAAANNIKLGALTWHEIVDNLGPNPEENSLLPSTIDDHVSQARALVAARPSLGNPKIFVTEYGMPEIQKIPGWDVGYLSALTNAGVDEASRACWNGDCGKPDLDGLLSANGKSPLPAYYDRLVYASMSGKMVATTSTSDTVTVLGSYDPSSRTITGLVGRGASCAQSLQGGCPSAGPGSSPGSPVGVNITVTVPWNAGAVQIALTRVSGSLAMVPAGAPHQVFTGERITPDGPGKGSITISIPNFNDGDAYGLRISH